MRRETPTKTKGSMKLHVQQRFDRPKDPKTNKKNRF